MKPVGIHQEVSLIDSYDLLLARHRFLAQIAVGASGEQSKEYIFSTRILRLVPALNCANTDQNQTVPLVCTF